MKTSLDSCIRLTALETFMLFIGICLMVGLATVVFFGPPSSRHWDPQTPDPAYDCIFIEFPSIPGYENPLFRPDLASHSLKSALDAGYKTKFGTKTEINGEAFCDVSKSDQENE